MPPVRAKATARPPRAAVAVRPVALVKPKSLAPKRLALEQFVPAKTLARKVNPLESRTTDGLRRVVTLEEAKKLFDQLAGAKDIPHDFIDEGCQRRAHVEAHRLEQAGVYSEKAVVMPEGGEDLRINSAKHPVGYTMTVFHTAPAVSVLLPDGKVERRVIDPSLFNGPVPVETWMGTMRTGNRQKLELFYMPRFAVDLADRAKPPTQWRQKDLDEALSWNEEARKLEQYFKENNYHDHLRQLGADHLP